MRVAAVAVVSMERLTRSAEHRLGVLIGGPPVALVGRLEATRSWPLSAPGVPAALLPQLLNRRPDLRRAEREVAAATARVGVATADLYPRFALGATLGRRSAGVTDLATGPSLFWAVGPTVRWPVLSGGRIRANIQVHEARLEQSRHRLESLTLTAIEEVENALVAHDLDQQRAQSLATAVAAAREALALATTRYTTQNGPCMPWKPS